VKGLEPLPDGTYTAEIVEAKEGSSQAGHPKIDLQWTIISPAEHAGRRIFDILSFHPDALFRTKATLVGLGFDGSFKGEISTEQMIGRKALLTVSTEVSTQTDPDGNPYPPRNRVKKVRAISAKK